MNSPQVSLRTQNATPRPERRAAGGEQGMDGAMGRTVLAIAGMGGAVAGMNAAKARMGSAQAGADSAIARAVLAKARMVAAVAGAISAVAGIKSAIADLIPCQPENTSAYS